MSEGWNLTPIVIPLIALLVGWAIGFFDSNMRTAKKIKQAEDSAQAAIKAAEMKSDEAQARMNAVAAPPPAQDDPGLLRLRNASGRLTLDLDGVPIDSPALTPDQRRRLIELLNIIRPWLEGRPASPPAAVSAPPPSPTPAPAPVAAPPPQPLIKPLSSAPKAGPAAKKKEEPEPPPTSIVGQINLVLQALILHTPLAERGVSLMESSSGGVNVYVGIQRYEAIDDVPDEEIKAAIRAAIAEWERKYTPGL